MRKHVIPALVLIAALAVLGLACGDGPTRPTPPGPTGLPRVELTGPATIAPGETARYTLSALLPSGGLRDVSDEAVWVTSIPTVLTLDKGRVTGLAVGEGPITAIYAGRSSVRTVVVSPAGTFRLKGTVLEENSNERIAGARVEVRTASGEVLQDSTRPDGTFVVYGVTAESELQVSHSDFASHTQRISLSDHGSMSLSLTRSIPRTPVAGTYTLTVGSAAGCEFASGGIPRLPDHLRQRTYTAVITENGKNLEVRLSGASFAKKPSGIANVFRGTVEGAKVRFDLWGPESYYYYYYSTQGADIVEALDEGTYLSPSGTAMLTRSNLSMQGTLTGAVRNRTLVIQGQQIGRCAGAIPFVFVKQ